MPFDTHEKYGNFVSLTGTTPPIRKGSMVVALTHLHQ